MKNAHLRRAYAQGVRQALNDTLMSKEAGIVQNIAGIPRAVRGGLWGAGIGGAHGALFGEGEDDIFRGLTTGGLLGAGAGYGSRYLSPKLRQTIRETPRELWGAVRGGAPGAGEQAMRGIGQKYEALLQNPAERQALTQGLKSMGLWGGAGAIAGGPLYNRMAEPQGRQAYPAYYRR